MARRAPPAEAGGPLAPALDLYLAHLRIEKGLSRNSVESYARDIRDRLGHGLELVLDGGYQPNEPSPVVNLTGPEPVVTRVGKGDATDL